MEPHATVAHWEGERLTLYDSTQGVEGVKKTAAKLFGIDPANVRCVCRFTGGGFGSKGSMWSHVILTAMAAKAVGRPVKLSLERNQMFFQVGFRPQTEPASRARVRCVRSTDFHASRHAVRFVNA